MFTLPPYKSAMIFWVKDGMAEGDPLHCLSLHTKGYHGGLATSVKIRGGGGREGEGGEGGTGRRNNQRQGSH